MTLRDDIAALKTRARISSTHDEISDIRRRLREGESTGDRLLDFSLIVHRDDLNGSAAQIYRMIEGLLLGKQDQLFVLGEYTCGLRLPQEPNPAPDVLTVGFLSNDQLWLDLETGNWGLRCHELVEVRGLHPAELCKGPACFGPESKITYLLNRYKRSVPFNPDPQLVVGDKDVLRWFKDTFHPPTEDDEAVLRDLVRLTAELTPPANHPIRKARNRLRRATFARMRERVIEIRELRDSIEDPGLKCPEAEVLITAVKKIRENLLELGREYALLKQLGYEQIRHEVEKIEEKFGRYWGVEAKR